MPEAPIEQPKDEVVIDLIGDEEDTESDDTVTDSDDDDSDDTVTDSDSSVDDDDDDVFPYTNRAHACALCGRAGVRLWRDICSDYEDATFVCSRHFCENRGGSALCVRWLEVEEAAHLHIGFSEFDNGFVPLIPFCVHDLVEETLKKDYKVWGYRDISTERPESEVMLEWWLDLPL
jgi:hypothetical protein